MHYDVVVPVKPLDLAKSRLLGQPRASLMRAFALDALAACVASPVVRAAYVVTDDAGLAEAVTTLGARVLPDHGDGSLNRALSVAVEALPDGAGVAALLGDLPCLRTDDLTAALGDVPTVGAVVADAEGTGSTILLTQGKDDFRPHFGPGSFGAHLAAGYADLTTAAASLRRDVDTAEDLHDAVALGVGVHTARILDAREGR